MTADIMQPDLDPLVPMHTSLEDFMDTLEAPAMRSGMGNTVYFADYKCSFHMLQFL